MGPTLTHVSAAARGGEAPAGATAAPPTSMAPTLARPIARRTTFIRRSPPRPLPLVGPSSVGHLHPSIMPRLLQVCCSPEELTAVVRQAVHVAVVGDDPSCLAVGVPDAVLLQLGQGALLP